MNNATHVILRDLLSRWLADPERDTEDAVLWCERHLARTPYSLIDETPEQIAYGVGGEYRRAHRNKLQPFTRLFTGG